MKISTKGRYGLEAVLDLAIYTSESHESIRNIARRRNVSENYLEQLFVVLRKKGIIDSIRGAQGGYRLARDPGEIKAGEIIRALEGNLSPVECVRDDSGRSCERYDKCVTRNLWRNIRDEINSAADEISIRDLMEACRKIELQDNNDYCI